MQIRPIGASDGKCHFENTDIPGGPEEIPGLLKRDTNHDWSMSGSGAPLLPHRVAKAGDAITVKTDQGGIRVRIGTVREPDAAMIGTVEILETPGSTAFDINGIRHGDSVIVRDMDFVQRVHIGR